MSDTQSTSTPGPDDLALEQFSTDAGPVAGARAASPDPLRQAAADFIFESLGRAKALRVALAYPPPDTGRGRTQQDANAVHEPFRIALLPAPVGAGKHAAAPPAGMEPLNLSMTEGTMYRIAVPDRSAEPDLAEFLKRWCGWTLGRLERALAPVQDQPPVKYAVFGELSFPNFTTGHFADSIAAEDTLRAMNAAFQHQVQTLARKYKAVIIGGSSHNPLTHQNVADIYFPDGLPPTRHRKHTAAQALDEHINIARGIRYPVYNLGPLNFCVLICSDAVDLNIFAQMLRAKKAADRGASPEIYFVPSFYIQREGQRHAMLRACQQLSKGTGETVIFVNRIEDPKRAAAFIAGYRVGDLDTFRNYTTGCDATLWCNGDRVSFLTVNRESASALKLQNDPFKQALQTLLLK